MSNRFKTNTPQRKVLSNPWNSQRDNKLSPSSSCNVTALQVALSLDYGITDDELFTLCNSDEMKTLIQKKYPRDGWILPYFTKKAANEIWVVVVEAAIKIIGDPKYVKFHQGITRDLIIKEIDNGYPVIVCGKFTGGHFVTIVGYDLEKKVWVIQDSWGNWNTKYSIKNGDNVEYEMSKLTIGSFLTKMAILVHADKRMACV
jgi:hypothetical protein